MQTLAVIGASLAGLSAARAARAQGFDGHLVVIGDEPERPYDRPPLSKGFLLGHHLAQVLLLENADENLDADWLLGVGARSLDSESKTITLDDGGSVTADHLVIATGATARSCPEFAGIGNAFTLRTLADARNLAPHLAPGKRLVVIGAGFIGSEVASAATTLGMQVTVVSSDPVPFSRQLGPTLGWVVAGLHERHGVELVSGTRVSEVHSSAGWATGVTLGNGRYLAADVVLLGVGAQPNTGWLADSGLATGDGVLCDAAGRTSSSGIVAVGDCAAWFDPAAGRHRRLEHWTGALERPALAVAALLGNGEALPAARPPYFWSDQYGTTIQFAGNAEFSDRVEVEAGDLLGLNFLAVYYRGEDPVAVLGLNQPRLFTKWRRALNRPAPGAHGAQVRSSHLVS